MTSEGRVWPAEAWDEALRSFKQRLELRLKWLDEDDHGQSPAFAEGQRVEIRAIIELLRERIEHKTTGMPL